MTLFLVFNSIKSSCLTLKLLFFSKKNPVNAHFHKCKLIYLKEKELKEKNEFNKLLKIYSCGMPGLFDY